jgi:hypothetical protein
MGGHLIRRHFPLATKKRLPNKHGQNQKKRIALCLLIKNVNATPTAGFEDRSKCATKRKCFLTKKCYWVLKRELRWLTVNLRAGAID